MSVNLKVLKILKNWEKMLTAFTGRSMVRMSYETNKKEKKRH